MRVRGDIKAVRDTRFSNEVCDQRRQSATKSSLRSDNASFAAMRHGLGRDRKFRALLNIRAK